MKFYVKKLAKKSLWVVCFNSIVGENYLTRQGGFNPYFSFAKVFEDKADAEKAKEKSEKNQNKIIKRKEKR